jgi:hypothetical protein
MSQTNTTPGTILPCIFCGEPEASINLCLSDASFTCRECDAEFTADDVRERFAKWQKLLAWVEQMPQS